MKIKVIVFDLDDTLFDELDYVRSGLNHTAMALADRQGWDVADISRQLLASLKVSRSHIFDRVLEQQGAHSQALVDFCVTTYREHTPDIRLARKVNELLKILSLSYPLYIVTDGHAGVQNNKLSALGLSDNSAISRCYATYAFGPEYAKPSPKCFQMIAESEGCQPSDIVYIADNPDKDFVGIRPHGFRTIRVMTGQHRHKSVRPEFDAEIRAADVFAACNLLSR